jgi:ribosomal protein S18 acetylase RimI-like enzyme
MIEIKEVPIETALIVEKNIPEFTTKYSKESYEDRLKDKTHLITVAFIDNKPAGYMISYNRYNDGSIYCWMTGVDPNFRKMGLLTQMMEFLKNWSKEKNFNKIKIKTRNSRREMLAYLIKNNFLLTSVEPKEDITENRILAEIKI